MKIVHVIPVLTKGGAERVAVDLANAQVQAGHEVAMLLAYPVDPALLQDQLDPRVGVRFVLAKPSRIGVYAAILPWIARHRGWLIGQDVVHCHLTFGSVFAAVLERMRRKGRPLTVETYHAVGSPISSALHRLHRRLAAGRDGFVTMAVDGLWGPFLNSRPPLRSAFIPNGVNSSPALPDRAQVAEVRRALGIPRDARVIGTIGRLLPERHPHRLMDVFVAVASEFPDVHVLIGGEGPERVALASRAAASGLSNRVHLPGLITAPAAVQLAIDLYLTINVGTITGIAALEAAALGVPVVAYQVDPAFKPGSDDWIWSSRDTRALADHAIGLIGDPVRRKTLAERQRGTVAERFSTDRMAAQYELFYNQLLAT